jgi:hypothetical protein
MRRCDRCKRTSTTRGRFPKIPTAVVKRQRRVCFGQLRIKPWQGIIYLKTQPAHVDQGTPQQRPGLCAHLWASPMSIAADRHWTQHPPFARRFVASSNCSTNSVRVQRITVTPSPSSASPCELLISTTAASRSAGRRQARNFGWCQRLAATAHTLERNCAL